jgi:hypothetical protein
MAVGVGARGWSDAFNTTSAGGLLEAQHADQPLDVGDRLGRRGDPLRRSFTAGGRRVLAGWPTTTSDERSILRDARRLRP